MPDPGTAAATRARAGNQDPAALPSVPVPDPEQLPKTVTQEDGPPGPPGSRSSARPHPGDRRHGHRSRCSSQLTSGHQAPPEILTGSTRAGAAADLPGSPAPRNVSDPDTAAATRARAGNQDPAPAAIGTRSGSGAAAEDGPPGPQGTAAARDLIQVTGDTATDHAAAHSSPAAHQPTAGDPAPRNVPESGTAGDGPQEDADNKIIEVLLTQIERKDKQIAELTEIVKRFQELQANNQQMIEQSTGATARATESNNTEIIIDPAPPDPDTAAAEDGTKEAEKISFLQKVKKYFFG